MLGQGSSRFPNCLRATSAATWDRSAEVTPSRSSFWYPKTSRPWGIQTHTAWAGLLLPGIGAGHGDTTKRAWLCMQGNREPPRDWKHARAWR